jgi:epoxyqueuosine reductase
LKGGGRIARYAAGRDYHNVLGKKLKKLRQRLAAAGLGGPARSIVDAGPLLERSHAAEAGLGFASKAANLLHPRFGPWFFLGEILLDDDLAPTEAPVAGSCGTCRACLDACPTQAIREPGVVDATLCISYHTIESREEIPLALRAKVGAWAFGCDVCSEVCPWGAKSPSLAERFGTHPWIAEAGLVEWLLAGPSLTSRLEGSPLRRPGRAGLARNAAIALGNQPSEDGRRGLLHALTFDPASLVREAAASALAAGHGEEAGVRAALERAAASEHDPASRARIEASRARCDDGS